MDYKDQLKLQALLDGELDEREAPGIAGLLARDAQAARLHEELRATREALSQASLETEAVLRLPESRDFFWSKVRRQIEAETRARPQTEHDGSWLTAWRRLLIPAGAIVALLLAALVTVGPRPFSSPASSESEASYDDSSDVFTYHDYNTQATLVWVTYPAEDDSAKVNPADDDAQ
ncbi:MAG TPA: hypothetical protein VHH88_00280 [Verrucomicrobiae bacterium]|nr:hypothetical protein [Verrucomicrobiae bacterium]